MPHLFCFGYGFSARALAARLPAGWTVGGTCRSAAKAAAMTADGVTAHVWSGAGALDPAALAGASHILLSVPPGDAGDPVALALGRQLAALPDLRWVGYLSTTGVYGDRGGAWVDEDTPPAPTSDRGARRLMAERQWLELHRSHGLPVHIFRLAGIYGPGRNQLEAVKAGMAKRIIKPGQIFARIHVEDIARVLLASIARPDPGRIYNVCDDEAAPPQEVVAYAAKLLGLPAPREVPFDEAELSPMGRSFYLENKRLDNARIKAELGVTLAYPTYREGLAALLTTLS